MKFIKVAWNTFIGLFALSLLVLAGLSIYFHTSFLVVISRSMEPTMQAGDLLLTRPVEISTIEISDVLVLPVPKIENLRYTHRVVEVSRELNGYFIKTKGDANPSPDAWILNVTDKEVPKVIAVLPTSLIFALTHIFSNDT
jgi:signal peptidase